LSTGVVPLPRRSGERPDGPPRLPSVSVNTTDPMIGRLIDGRYQIRSRIARGGMATVYLATDLRLERRVAVKVMHGHLADDSSFKQRFIQEARSAARLAHPNVVNVFDQGQDADSAYLVMEYLPGITLRELLQEHGALTPAQTLDITEAVLSGLAAAHRAGIVHRDLKPENVLLADDGRIKIGDFGLARAASANTATGAALMGTIAYLAPELVTRGSADTRSDIYAVGIMMFEMLTGDQPFKGEQPLQIAYQHANDSVPAPSGRNSRVPAELDELVLWATAREPERRPADAQQLLDQVQDTESMLQTALETGGVAIQRTMVLAPARTTGPITGPLDDEAPGASDGAADETVVLGARGSLLVDDANPATNSLAVVGRRQRRRRPVIAVIIVVVALLAAGVGWWFGAGPGAHTTIPAEIVSSSPADARTILQDLGFAVDPENATTHSIDVPEGRVVDTNPAAGTSVRNGSEIQLIISLGPRGVTLPALAGMPVDEAVALLTADNLVVPSPIEQFSSDVEAGLVIAVRDLDADGADLSDGGDTFEGREMEVVVSVGAVPTITGLEPDAATTALAGAGLSVDRSKDQESYSGSVDEGLVITLVDAEGARHPGDTVGLVISRGPEPVAIPSVIDRPWLEAKQLLDDAGFVIAFVNENSQIIANSVPGIAVLREISPAVGEKAPRGSTVTVRLSAG